MGRGPNYSVCTGGRAGKQALIILCVHMDTSTSDEQASKHANLRDQPLTIMDSLSRMVMRPSRTATTARADAVYQQEQQPSDRNQPAARLALQEAQGIWIMLPNGITRPQIRRAIMESVRALREQYPTRSQIKKRRRRERPELQRRALAAVTMYAEMTVLYEDVDNVAHAAHDDLQRARNDARRAQVPARRINAAEESGREKGREKQITAAVALEGRIANSERADRALEFRAAL